MKQLANAYLNEVIRFRGVAKDIVSDRDSRFLSNFLKKLQEAMETILKFSTNFHPATDGQTERTTQTLEDLLRVCMMNFGGALDENLMYIEFSHNNSYHASIRIAPYEALHGRKCRSSICWDDVNKSRNLGLKMV